MIGMRQTATIYTRGTGGAFTVVDKSSLACRLNHLRGGDSAASRAEMLQTRHMQWDDIDYVMPRACQVEVDGLRWQPRPETFGSHPGPAGTLICRSVDVVRAQT